MLYSMKYWFFDRLEGTLCKRERSLILLSLFFLLSFYDKLANAIHLNIKGAAFTCKACPSLETVETVSKFTLCETLEGLCRALPRTPPETLSLDSAKGLSTLRKPFFIVTLENHFSFFLRFEQKKSHKKCQDNRQYCRK